MPAYEELYQAVLEGNAPAAKAVTARALENGANPQELLDDCMIPAMDKVGELFESNEYFVPELLIAARAMKGALELLRPLLAAQGTRSAGKVAIGTVRGDLHDIGKNLVAAMLEGGGFEVIDLGVDVPAEKFVDAISKTGVQVVAMSALLTTTMPGMRSTIDAIREAGVRDKVKIMVGGAPITQSFADEIGADGFSDNASGAVRMARELIAK